MVPTPIIDDATIASEVAGYCTAAIGGRAFRIEPLDGPAAYPRTVEVGGRKVVVSNNGWVRGPFQGLRIQALGDVAPALANAASAELAGGRQAEKWLVIASPTDCDLPQVPAVQPGRQLIYAADVAALPVGNRYTSVIDARPFDAIRVLSKGGSAYGGVYFNPIEADSGDANWPSGAFGTTQLSLTGTTITDALLSRFFTGTSAPVTGIGSYWLPSELFQLQAVQNTAPSTVHLRVYGIRLR